MQPPASQSSKQEFLGKDSGKPVGMRVLAFSAVFWLCAASGSLLSARDTSYVSFWLPGGLYLAALLLHETRTWPKFMAGALVANLAFDLAHGTPFWVTMGFYSANTLQATIGAWMVRRFISPFPSMTSLREFGGLFAFGAMLAGTAGAVVGAGTLTIAHLSKTFLHSFLTWWASNGMAIMVVSPFALAWFSPRRDAEQPFRTTIRIVEALLLAALMSGAAYYLLVSGSGINSANKSLLMPFLIWAGLRFKVRGAAAASLLLTLLLTVFTTQYLKGLTAVEVASGEYVLTLQIFAAMCVAVGMIPAIVMAERDKKVEELSESEDRFRNLTAAAFEGVVISQDGVILDVNEQCLKMFGCGRDYLVGRRVPELISPETRETAEQSIRAQQDAVYEHKLYRQDGSTFLAEARARMVRTGDKKLRMTALQDISERRAAEEALRQSEERLRAVVENAPEAIVVFDMDKGRFVHVNENACQLFKATREELLNLNPFALSPPIQPDGSPSSESGKAKLEIALQGKPFRFEWTHRDLLGRDFACEVHLSRFPSTSDRMLRGSILDLTEKKEAEAKARQLEEQLRQAHKLEALGTLAGGTAHEFNNILSIVMAYSELSMEELGANHVATRYLNEILTASRRAKAIVQQVLTFSRQQRLELQLINLRSTVEDAARAVRATVPHNVRVETVMEAAEAAVLANITQIHQVVTNLCNNSWQAMEGAEGVIQITLSKTSLTREQAAGIHHELREGDHGLLSISDNGAGMDEATQKRLFEPFFTTKGPGGGSGLGLAVVHGIVHSHNGAIVVRSKPGEGTVFDLYFPLEKGRPPADPVITGPTNANRAGAGRVLVVDDEKSLVEVTKRMLERAGYSVATAGCVRDALAHFKSTECPFDLVITDLTMPEMSGHDLARKLGEIAPNLPVILATGFDSVSSATEANLPNLKSVLQKPFSTGELFSLVEEVLSKSKS